MFHFVYDVSFLFPKWSFHDSLDYNFYPGPNCELFNKLDGVWGCQCYCKESEMFKKTANIQNAVIPQLLVSVSWPVVLNAILV